MWVFTTLGFFSIVQHRQRPSQVCVRARARGDLDQLVALMHRPKPEIVETPDADYRFRIVIGKRKMAALMERLTRAIGYDNFKNAVADDQGLARAHVYHDIWTVLSDWQKRIIG